MAVALPTSRITRSDRHRDLCFDSCVPLLGASRVNSGRLAILLTFLLNPVTAALERIGLVRLSSVMLVAVLTFSLLGGIGWIVTFQFGSLANELPQYTGNLRQKIADVRGAAKGGAIEKVQQTVEAVTSEIEQDDKRVKGKISALRSSCGPRKLSRFLPLTAIGPMLERLASVGLVIVLVIFMLMQREDLRIVYPSCGLWPFDLYDKRAGRSRAAHKPLSAHADNHQFDLWTGSGFGILFDRPAIRRALGFSCRRVAVHSIRRPFPAAIMPSALSWRYSKVGCGQSWL